MKLPGKKSCEEFCLMTVVQDKRINIDENNNFSISIKIKMAHSLFYKHWILLNCLLLGQNSERSTLSWVCTRGALLRKVMQDLPTTH